MKVTGTATLSAGPQQVFDALNDPDVLVATIPGVQSLEQVEPDRYRMTVVAGVASIKGAYDGEVRLCDQQPPTSFTLRAKGAGAPGTVDATVRVSLTPQDGGTRLEYDADAVVGGMVGGVGQRMLTSVSRKMAGQFFGNVDTVLRDGVPTAAVAPAGERPADRTPAPAGEQVREAPSAGAVFRAPSSRADDSRVPFWVVLAGVGTGAVWALAGVAVGWALARRPR